MIWGAGTGAGNNDEAASSTVPPALDDVKHDAETMGSANQHGQKCDKYIYSSKYS